MLQTTDSDDISVVDLDARREVRRISIGGSPRGSVRFYPNMNFGYVSNTAGNTISVIDIGRDREVAKITVGLAPRGLVLSADGNNAYVSNSGDNTLSVVDLIERKESRKIAMGEKPRHMAIIPRSGQLLITQWGSDSIANINVGARVTDLSTARAIHVGDSARPYSVAVMDDGRAACVANTQADYISVIDPPSGKEISRISVGYGGRAVALSPDGKYAFASVENSNEVVS